CQPDGRSFGKREEKVNAISRLFSDLLISIVAFAAAAFAAEGNDLADWLPEQQLTHNLGESELSYNFARSIAVDENGAVHVVWFSKRDGKSQVYYKRSLDGGNRWEKETVLSDIGSDAGYPAVAVSGKYVYVV